MTDTGSAGDDAPATTLRGRVETVDPVSTGKVPSEYPVDITTDRSLAVQVAFADPTTEDGTVYYPWPPIDGGPLERLLELRDVWPDDITALRGEQIPVGVVDGRYVPVGPGEGPAGSPLGYPGLVLGLGGTLAIVLGLIVGVIHPSMSVATALLVLNVVLLPTATYLDGWYLRSRTDWDRNPLLWAALAGFLGPNLLSVGAYLYLRRSARRY